MGSRGLWWSRCVLIVDEADLIRTRIPLTDRDHRLLREVGALGAVPIAHLLGFFPTPAAGYVRLGVLARRDLVRRFSALGSRWVRLSPSGATAVGMATLRMGARMTERRAATVSVHCLLTSCGYLRVPPPPATPNRFLYYCREGGIVAVGVTVRPLRGGSLRVLTQLIIFSPAARIVQKVIVFAPGTMPQRLHEVPNSWQSRVILMPIPGPMSAAIMRTHLLTRLR